MLRLGPLYLSFPAERAIHDGCWLKLYGCRGRMGKGLRELADATAPFLCMVTDIDYREDGSPYETVLDTWMGTIDIVGVGISPMYDDVPDLTIRINKTRR